MLFYAIDIRWVSVVFLLLSKISNQQHVKQTIIEPSDSPYNAPMWVVPKELDASNKQKCRIVIDFRKLNEQTDQGAYPLPNSD